MCLPTQCCLCRSMWNPCLHWHLYDPWLFWHIAPSLLHCCLKCFCLHSSTSEIDTGEKQAFRFHSNTDIFAPKRNVTLVEQFKILILGIDKHFDWTKQTARRDYSSYAWCFRWAWHSVQSFLVIFLHWPILQFAVSDYLYKFIVISSSWFISLKYNVSLQQRLLARRPQETTRA